MKKELIAHEDPKSPISEIFRTLRTNIQFMNNKKKLQTILITSTLPGEGKSWVSSNLATTFAQAGKKVVLVDADMRKGRQYTIFGIAPRPGLSNYLSDYSEEEGRLDIADYVQETEVEGLYVIPAGNVPPNPSELLISETMLNLMEQLKQICDVVILDGPPTQLVTDSLIIARIVDSTVVVTASKQTKKEDLRRIVDNIQKVGGRVAGIVLNKVTISAKKYEQTYYYGSTSSSHHGNKKDVNLKRKMQNGNTGRKEENKRVDNKPNKPPVMKQGNNNKNNQKEAQELPKAFKKDIKSGNKEEISLEKTNDILKQINKYLDQEKKNLNKK